MASVWVVTYYNTSDEGDNGVTGVYTAEGLAREGGIAEARKQPGLAEARMRWFGESLRSYSKRDKRWYDVRPCFQVAEWEIEDGSPLSDGRG